LIPRGYGLKTLGLLMNSYIFADRNKTYNETWMLGGREQEELLKLSDENLLKLIAEERFKILGQTDKLLDYRINRWNHALPFYDLQLEETLNTLETMKPTKDLYLHGNYLGGIGLSKILDRSQQIAEEITQQYG
ncbi:MAG: hypothetical protein AAGB31_02875, partial [Bdellovibrio sp.]